MSYCSTCRSVIGYADGVGWCADCGGERVFVAEFDECGTITHRSDPRTMEDRWLSLGFVVGWSDTVRAYVAIRTINPGTPVVLRTVDEVEAYVVARAEARP